MQNRCVTQYFKSEQKSMTRFKFEENKSIRILPKIMYLVLIKKKKKQTTEIRLMPLNKSISNNVRYLIDKSLLTASHAIHLRKNHTCIFININFPI